MMELFFCLLPLTINPVIDFVASLVEEPLTTIPSHIFPMTQISEPKNKSAKRIVVKSPPLHKDYGP